MASTPQQALGGFVRGVSEEGLKALPLIANNIRFGTLDGFDSQEGIAIGTRLANSLRVNVGDSVTLVSPRGAVDALRHGAARQALQGGGDLRDGHVRVRPHHDLHAAGARRSAIFNKGDAVDVLEVLVEDPEKVARAGGHHEARPASHRCTSSDWRQRNESFFTVLEVERNMMFIILSVIVLVAAFNIISGLIMLVKDKGREIGILRTMGASKGAIMRVFLITGASIGVVGTLAGCGARHPVLLEDRRDPPVRRLAHQHQPVQSRDLLPDAAARRHQLRTPPASSSLMALVLSVLATLYPSWRASRLDPVEALRYE